MAVVLAVAVVLFAVGSVVAADSPHPGLRVLSMLCAWFGGSAMVALAATLTWRRAKRWVERRLVDLAGPAIVKSMPPRQVLDTLLPMIYGERVGYQHITASVLGGAGRELDGRDTAVSKKTSAHFGIRALDPHVCRSESTWTHEFSGVRNAHRFVIFATFDRDVADLIPTERLYPLFEFWKLEDEDQLEDFVPMLRETLRVGITYLDADGVRHTVTPRREKGEEVAYRKYDQFIRLPDDIDRQNLRIIQFDLFDLADPDHVVDSIESLTLSATNDFPLDLGYLRWSPPHPCYMEDVVFDVEHMRPEAVDLVYRVVPSTAKAQALAVDHAWSSSDDQIKVELNAWMLPGHSVTLLWRPADESESYGRPESR
jgi:hypothetical protein